MLNIIWNNKLILWCVFIIGLIILLFVLGATLYIELKVKETCENATGKYPGDKIQALINIIQDESKCTKQKSHALWALGRLGDKSALSFLKENYDNKHEDNPCVYEARFAINKISKEKYNLPGFLWRWTWTK